MSQNVYCLILLPCTRNVIAWITLYLPYKDFICIIDLIVGVPLDMAIENINFNWDRITQNNLYYMDITERIYLCYSLLGSIAWEENTHAINLLLLNYATIWN